MSIIAHGILLGLIVPFLLGPVFFALIDTSLSRGIRAALFLELGIIVSDILAVYIAYLFSSSIEPWLRANMWIQWVGGIALMGYGAYLYFKKRLVQHSSDSLSAQTSSALAFKGFILNAANPGVLVFWLSVVVIVGETFSYQRTDMMLHFGVVFLTFVAVDLGKIFLAVRLRRVLSNSNIQRVTRVSGVLLFIWGAIIALLSIVK
jgi:threonine/homoserine/homoserine lactone efflux protein